MGGTAGPFAARPAPDRRGANRLWRRERGLVCVELDVEFSVFKLVWPLFRAGIDPTGRTHRLGCSVPQAHRRRRARHPPIREEWGDDDPRDAFWRSETPLHTYSPKMRGG